MSIFKKNKITPLNVEMIGMGSILYDVKILDRIVWFSFFFCFHNAWSFGL